MPMIPKPMTDINSESAYEKLKFIPEHYNEIMAAYTDIMEHLKLPVMTDTGGGGGGSGEECLHEVVEVTNPCPAYVEFIFNIKVSFTGIRYVYKDIDQGGYTIQNIYGYDDNGISTGLMDIIQYLSLPITIGYYTELADKPILPSPSNPNLVYAAMLVDKTTGEPVGMSKYNDIDGIQGNMTTYADLINAYDVKLVLADPYNYSVAPIILGNLHEKIVELRSNVDTDSPRAKLPTPEEFLRILQVNCNNYNPTKVDAKVGIALLTPEERARIRSNLKMSTSNSVPSDNEYSYAINLFCHPNVLNGYTEVNFSCVGGYSKGFINFGINSKYGLINNGCEESGAVTYRQIILNLVSTTCSESCEYFVLPDSSSTEENTGLTITPYTFKLIQSKEGIDRRL